MIIGLVTGGAIVVLACAVLILIAYAIRHYALAMRRLVAGNPRDPFELRGFVMPRVVSAHPDAQRGTRRRRCPEHGDLRFYTIEAVALAPHVMPAVQPDTAI